MVHWVLGGHHAGFQLLEGVSLNSEFSAMMQSNRMASTDFGVSQQLSSVCRGKPYYMRENLAELHTAEAWKMKVTCIRVHHRVLSTMPTAQVCQLTLRPITRHLAALRNRCYAATCASVLLFGVAGMIRIIRSTIAHHSTPVWCQPLCGEQEGREVVADQLATPAKEVKKRGYKPSGKDRPLDLEDDQVCPGFLLLQIEALEK